MVTPVIIREVEETHKHAQDYIARKLAYDTNRRPPYHPMQWSLHLQDKYIILD
jgi:hypothetical protein